MTNLCCFVINLSVKWHILILLAQAVRLICRGVATAGDTGDASPVRPTMSPLHQNDNRQFVFGADF